MQSTTVVGSDGALRVPTDALVVVSDSEHCRFFRNAGTANEPSFELIDSLKQDNPSASEHVSDRPGRFNDGSSVHRSAVQETDHHELEKQRFAHRVADILNGGARERAYRDLVLVAGPRVLGAIRSQLSSEVRDRIIAELDKNLAHHTAAEVQKLVTTA